MSLDGLATLNIIFYISGISLFFILYLSVVELNNEIYKLRHEVSILRLKREID